MSATELTLERRPEVGRSRELQVAVERVMLVLLPTALFAALLVLAFGKRHSALGFDYRYAYWTAGERVLHGQNPYAWTPHQIAHAFAFVYPAFAAVVFAPLSLLGRDAGTVAFALLGIGLAPATLWVLRVRDWRVYAVTFMWLPVVLGWETANESLFLVLGTAIAWRYRDRPGILGFLVAALISLKPLMWPLGIWLLATRRWKAVGWGLGWGLVLNLISWSIVGFGTIGTFLHTAAADTNDAWRTGFGVAAMAAHLGFSRSAGDAATVFASAALAIGVLYAGLVRRDERQSLTLALALAPLSSPLVWSHYFALMLVPLALYRPRLGWLWFVPLLAWFAPGRYDLHGWQVAATWLAVVPVVWVLVRSSAKTPSPPDAALT